MISFRMCTYPHDLRYPVRCDTTLTKMHNLHSKHETLHGWRDPQGVNLSFTTFMYVQGSYCHSGSSKTFTTSPTTSRCYTGYFTGSKYLHHHQILTSCSTTFRISRDINVHAPSTSVNTFTSHRATFRFLPSSKKHINGPCAS